MMTQYVTFKTLGTFLCYGLRVAFEWSIVEKSRRLQTVILDLSYLGAVFFTFNIAQKNPTSEIHAVIGHLLQSCPNMSRAEWGYIFWGVALLLWVLAMGLNKKFSKLGKTTDSTLIKKCLLFGGSVIITLVLVGTAVITQ